MVPFCTYIGFFDLFMRQRVIQLWREKLDEAEIKQKEDISIIVAFLQQVCTPPFTPMCCHT